MKERIRNKNLEFQGRTPRWYPERPPDDIPIVEKKPNRVLMYFRKLIEEIKQFWR